MTQRADYIIPECYIDTNLVETLVCTAGCNHQKGCNQVAKVMMDKFSDRFAVGIIDADKRKPGYLNEFSIIASSKHIELFRHSCRPHFMILVHPAADGFILACAEAAGVNIKDYNLPPTLKEFTSQTKNVMSSKDLRFKRLFRSMENSGEIYLLKSLISYLTSTDYNADDEEISSIFRNF